MSDRRYTIVVSLLVVAMLVFGVFTFATCFSAQRGLGLSAWQATAACS